MSISDLYKTDISFEVSATGDFERTSNQMNVYKALERRILTTPGSLAHRPGYGVGLKQFQNAIMNIGKKRELASRLEEQLPQDPRVNKVLGVSISQNSANTSLVKLVVRVDLVGSGEETFTFEVGDLPE